MKSYRYGEERKKHRSDKKRESNERWNGVEYIVKGKGVRKGDERRGGIRAYGRALSFTDSSGILI